MEHHIEARPCPSRGHDQSHEPGVEPGSGGGPGPQRGVRPRCAFISGITGQFFRQFALTIATSTILSAFNSLTLRSGASGDSVEASQEGRAQRLAVGVVRGVSRGWAAYRYLSPWANREDRACRASCRRSRWTGWLAATPWGGGGGGRMAGGIAALGVNYLLGMVSSGRSIARFSLATSRLHLASGAVSARGGVGVAATTWACYTWPAGVSG